MVRDLRLFTIYGLLLLVVLGGVLAVGIAGRKGIPLGPAPAEASRTGKVISLSLAAEEIIVGLDGPERLAAVTGLALDPRFSNVAVEAARVGRAVSGTSIERIVRLGPELVIVAPYTDSAARSALERYGIRLLPLKDFDGIRAIQEGIGTIGKALQLEARAAALVEDMDRRIAGAGARLHAGQRRPRVLRYDPADPWVAGSGTVIDDVIRLAGGTNVAAENGVSGTRSVRKETVARWNPEVLLVEGEPAARRAIEERLQGDAVFQGVTAIHRLSTGAAGAPGLVVLPTRTLTAVSQFAAEAVERLSAELFPMGAPYAANGAGAPQEGR